MVRIKLKENLPNEINTINMPWQIGCGMAGGDWDEYLKVINEFAENLPLNIKIKIWRLQVIN